MTTTKAAAKAVILPYSKQHLRLLETLHDLQKQRRTAIPLPLIFVAMNAVSNKAKGAVSLNLDWLCSSGYLEYEAVKDQPEQNGLSVTPWGREQLERATAQGKPPCEKPLETPEPQPFSNAEQPTAQALSLACLLCDLAEVLSAQIAVAQEAGDWAEVRRLMELGQRTINAEKELTE